jgi:hypothetical protein
VAEKSSCSIALLFIARPCLHQHGRDARGSPASMSPPLCLVIGLCDVASITVDFYHM